MSVVIKRVDDVAVNDSVVSIYDEEVFKSEDTGELNSKLNFVQALSYIGMKAVDGSTNYLRIGNGVVLSVEMTSNCLDEGYEELDNSARVLITAIEDVIPNTDDNEKRQFLQNLLDSYWQCHGDVSGVLKGLKI